MCDIGYTGKGTMFSCSGECCDYVLSLCFDLDLCVIFLYRSTFAVRSPVDFASLVVF